MGMQEALNILTFLLAYKVALLSLAGVAVFYAIIELWAKITYGPRDTTNNGITVGEAKAFDNRSLTLRIERLSNHLEALKVVNQNVTDNLGKTQQQTSTQSTTEVSAEYKSSLSNPKEKGEDSTKTKTTDGSSKSESKTASNSAGTGAGKVELAASDVLSEQLNLASQILNLEMLYERSLTDRLIDNKTRLQTVLGFQVSITPPHGCENAVAVVEIAVRMKSGKPVSLVAMIPQEKTYNSQTFSTSAHSIGGSAVTNVLTLGVNRKGESQQLFIHRDSDTIAFERYSQSRPTLFDNDVSARVFGWEFRPVLGHSSVAPGTRQMLAVIALPIEDPEKDQQGVVKEITLEIMTRSYWRHFNKRKQTTGEKWSLVPWRIDRSLRVDSGPLELKIPTTNQIQDALAPQVTDVKWVNSGGDRATVIVRGANFFTGTKVVVGGIEHSEGDEDHKLVLKSNQALEFETSIASLGKGDCVLSGRFGRSDKLLASLAAAKERNIEALVMTQAVIKPNAFTDTVYLLLDIKAIDKNADDVDLEVADIQQLPEPILFLGAEAVPLPYDYFDRNPEVAPERVDTTAVKGANLNEDRPAADTEAIKMIEKAVGTIKEAAAGIVSTVPGAEASSESVEGGNGKPTPAPQVADKEPALIIMTNSTKKYVQVGAWVSKKLTASRSVTFRVPFCGLEYQASEPLIYSDVTASRMGNEGEDCVFRIISPAGFKEPVRVELDDTYDIEPELKKMSPFDYRFKVPIKTAARYQNILLRMGDDEPFLLPISVEEKPALATTLMASGKPPQIKKDSAGSLEWSGTALDKLRNVTLVPKSQSSDSKPTEVKERRIELDFAVYDEGTKVEVYFTPTDTAVAGKATLEFVTDTKTIRASLFITPVATAC